ncbi:hypothetical protein [Prochlorococcus marinus]|uniref:hypothetical protein n=1 Tax=Prochlorococcus marinus TaxID=1219 RepID=UPI001ADC96AE|nr:hypothetical protein [Prochlorococcus marinus]MBO8219362.1 hypothetical protein [Prochlorococcus marinus CUG1416]MBW3051743.1 hypothetical protein [Prochlorococcus marinus str. MU1416]
MNPVQGGYGGEGTKNKAEKISKYKTQIFINYVNLTVNFLNATEEKNERHMILFTNCQKLLNGNKKTVKGKDKKNLMSCTNLMKKGTYYKETNSPPMDSLQKFKTTKKDLNNIIYPESNNFKNKNNIKTNEDLENIRLKELKEEQFKRLQEKQLKKLEEKQLKEKLLKEKMLKQLKEKQLRELRELQERQIRELDEKKVKQLEQKMLQELKERRIEDYKNRQKRIKKDSNLLFN